MPRRLAVPIVLAALVILALLVPVLGGDYYVHVFALVFTNVILAASLRPSLTCGQLNIGHSAFMSIGAYTSALLAKNLAVPFELSMLCGALLAAAVGLAIGYPSLRLRGVYFAMVTVAFVEVIRLIAQLWVSLTRGMSGLSGIPKPSLLGMTLTTRVSQYYLVVGLTLVILLVLWKLEHSRLGLIWKSIGLGDNLAQSLGVDIARHKLLAFMLGCFFAGTAGAFYAHFIRFLFPPEFGFLMATNILVYNYVGGRGHFVGAIVGAIFLSLLSEPFRGSPYETIFFSIAMLLTILFLPGGLITLPRKLAELKSWRELTRLFGGLAAVNRVDLTVDKGEIVGLIGPNGAGKTTCFNLLSGFLRPTRGSIVFDGEDITGLRPHQIAARGLVRTFQLTTLFQDMTALENVLLGLHLHSGTGPRNVLFSRRPFPADEIARGRDVLDFTGLAAHGDQLTRNLPHGHQRVLGIAMALAAQPRLLLLDEPVTGMNLDESGRVMDLVKTIRSRGTTILLVEHNMKAVMGTCERIVVLNFGQKLAEGTPAQVGTSPDVIQAYLGTGLAHA